MFFKEKEPEPINNHVVRTIIEAKYTIQDMSLAEVQLIRRALTEFGMGRGYPYSHNQTPELRELLAKIQL